MAGMMSHGRCWLNQAVQSKDVTLAVVVGAQRDEHVLDGRQQRDRPYDERERAEHDNSSARTLPMPPLPATSALVTYMGLVPISPYTTPSVTSIAEMLTGIAACEAALLGLLFHKPVSSQL